MTDVVVLDTDQLRTCMERIARDDADKEPVVRVLPPPEVMELIVPGATWRHASCEDCPVAKAGLGDHDDAITWMRTIDTAVRELGARTHIFRVVLS